MTRVSSSNKRIEHYNFNSRIIGKSLSVVHKGKCFHVKIRIHWIWQWFWVHDSRQAAVELNVAAATSAHLRSALKSKVLQCKKPCRIRFWYYSNSFKYIPFNKKVSVSINWKKLALNIITKASILRLLRVLS